MANLKMEDGAVSWDGVLLAAGPVYTYGLGVGETEVEEYENVHG